MGRESFERAAWAGLQDSMPRAALLSLHARVTGVRPDTWEDPALIQVWGPRFSAYVIAARDLAVFTIGRHPDDEKGMRRAEETAAKLHAHLAGRRSGYAQAGDELGVKANSLRYATTTGTVVLRWEGARQPVIWTVPRPDIAPREARLELARRYLHVFGPTTSSAFAEWAGVGAAQGRSAFESLASELVEVATPTGTSWMLLADEPSFRAAPSPAAAARLLPSGDTYYLLQGSDRELLVPDSALRPLLWTPRVWPGALLLDGEIVGVWRRDQADVSIETWRKLSAAEREAVESEAATMPLPALTSPIRVRWSS
jgi:hypothetical protein